MRSEPEIKKLILDKAVSDERVRAVLLSGSRANKNISPDEWQDFDITYIVNDINSFINDQDWTDVFGEKIIEQLPDTMQLYKEDRLLVHHSFTYLMLFTDGNRIDLTLHPVEKINSFTPESLTAVLLDKDELFITLPAASDADYLIVCPTQKEFTDVCNEFWWVSTYVAKGLMRNQIPYAKENMESVVRPMFMKMIEWHIGISTDFSVSIGKSGKFIERYAGKDFYSNVLSTYAGYSKDEIWLSLFEMIRLFSKMASEVSIKLQFYYNLAEENNVQNYLRKLHEKSL